MLFISLVLSLLLLLWLYMAARHSPTEHWSFYLGGVCFGFGSVCLGGFFPPVALLFVFLYVSLIICYWCGRRRWLLPTLTGLSLLAAYGLAGWYVVEDQEELAELRREFPYESMEEKLPAPRPDLRPRRLPVVTADRLARLEGSLREDGWRPIFLQKLHADTVKLFINSPGFGVARMLRPDRFGLTGPLKPDHTVTQPQSPSDALWSADDGKWTPSTGGYKLADLHEGAILDFASPNGFGFFKDRRHVAGFEPHRMTEVPGPAEHWLVQRVDLIGLLLHEQPVAYVSAELPRMDKLRKAPLRALDRFETSALDKLRRGEDMIVGSAPGRLRMVGAIRSLKQCVSCHGGERGDLLGAFSYRLRRKEP